MKLTILFLDDTVETYDIDHFDFSYMYPDKITYYIGDISYDLYLMDVCLFDIT